MIESAEVDPGDTGSRAGWKMGDDSPVYCYTVHSLLRSIKCSYTIYYETRRFDKQTTVGLPN